MGNTRSIEITDHPKMSSNNNSPGGKAHDSGSGVPLVTPSNKGNSGLAASQQQTDNSSIMTVLKLTNPSATNGATAAAGGGGGTASQQSTTASTSGASAPGVLKSPTASTSTATSTVSQSGTAAGTTSTQQSVPRSPPKKRIKLLPAEIKALNVSTYEQLLDPGHTKLDLTAQPFENLNWASVAYKVQFPVPNQQRCIDDYLVRIRSSLSKGPPHHETMGKLFPTLRRRVSDQYHECFISRFLKTPVQWNKKVTIGDGIKQAFLLFRYLAQKMEKHRLLCIRDTKCNAASKSLLTFRTFVVGFTGFFIRAFLGGPDSIESASKETLNNKFVHLQYPEYNLFVLPIILMAKEMFFNVLNVHFDDQKIMNMKFGQASRTQLDRLKDGGVYGLEHLATQIDNGGSKLFLQGVFYPSVKVYSFTCSKCNVASTWKYKHEYDNEEYPPDDHLYISDDDIKVLKEHRPITGVPSWAMTPNTNLRVKFVASCLWQTSTIDRAMPTTEYMPTFVDSDEDADEDADEDPVQDEE
jgi:hypothetical protein